jgi:hypothetical protein
MGYMTSGAYSTNILRRRSKRISQTVPHNTYTTQNRHHRGKWQQNNPRHNIDFKTGKWGVKVRKGVEFLYRPLSGKMEFVVIVSRSGVIESVFPPVLMQLHILGKSSIARAGTITHGFFLSLFL